MKKNISFHKIVKIIQLNKIDYLIFLLNNNEELVNDRDMYQRTLLLIACEKANIDIIKLLINYGSDLNVIDSYGDNIIHRCCRFNCIHVLSFLLQDTHLYDKIHNKLYDKNKNGLTPFHYTAEFGTVEMMKLLLNYHININEKDYDDRNGLFKACSRKNIPIINFLITNGIDINSVDKYGNSALHRVCINGYIEIIQLLLKSGADLYQKNINESNPLKYYKIHCMHKNISYNIVSNQIKIFETLYKKEENWKRRKHFIFFLSSIKCYFLNNMVYEKIFYIPDYYQKITSYL
jgi:ankyrin repeat protein